MVNTPRRVVVRVALLLALFAARALPAAAQASLCRTIEYPGAVPGTTAARGINSAGDIVGEYASVLDLDDGSGTRYHGFLLSGGQYSTIDYPGAVQTQATGINDAGQIVGFTSYPGAAHGFLLVNGQFSVIAAPGGSGRVTQVNAINNAGDVAGFYNGLPDFREHGFAIVNGSFSTIDFPGVQHNGAWGINDAGVVVGWASDATGGGSWKWESGQLTPLGDFPGSFPNTAEAFGINKAGKIVGSYSDLNFAGSSFEWASGRFSQFNCPGTSGTQAFAINEKGSIVGRYGSPDGMGSIAFVTPPIGMVDPVAELLGSPRVTEDGEALATAGRDVQGVAADGVSRVVLRVPAARAGDQVTLTVLNDKDPPVASHSQDDDGALCKPPGVPCDQSQITVEAVDTSHGVFAFAVYRAPIDFPRPTGADDAKTVRDVSVRVQSPSSGEATVPLKIVRPPVLLIHGLWSDKHSWDSFAPLVTGPETADPRFAVFRPDFSFQVGPLLGFTTPTYPANLLLLVGANSLGFEFNADVVSSLIVPWMEDFKAARNPARISVAAVQVDVVGHSMGGDIARTMTVRRTYRGANTFGEGVIHKLITIDTPHLGSPLATGLMSPANDCLRRKLASFAKAFTFQSVALDGVPGGVSGAVADLVDSPRSPVLQAMASSTVRLSTSMLGGVTTDFSSLDCHFRCTPNLLRTLCGNDPLAQHLTSAGWPGVFGGAASDAIVSETSQGNGGAVARSAGLNRIHSQGMRDLGFTGLSVLEDPGMAQGVIDLLNTPKTNRGVYPLVP